jgi:cytochrome c oxidase assembly protein subunit 11
MTGGGQGDAGRRRNARLGLLLGGLVFGMVGLAFASVPLYRLFCQVTGYGGTTRVAEAAPPQAGERLFKIRFNADVHRDLPWRFQPEQREVSLRVGESGLAFYRARNLSKRPVTGTATFNVTPLKAGQYFSKVQCFCFDQQTLAPGETASLGVSFFIDPAILADPNLDEVGAITLSYTFFRDLEDQDAAPRAGVAPEQQQASTGPRDSVAR